MFDSLYLSKRKVSSHRLKWLKNCMVCVMYFNHYNIKVKYQLLLLSNRLAILLFVNDANLYCIYHIFVIVLCVCLFVVVVSCGNTTLHTSVLLPSHLVFHHLIELYNNDFCMKLFIKIIFYYTFILLPTRPNFYHLSCAETHLEEQMICR